MSSVGPSNPDNLNKGAEPSKAVNPEKFKKEMTKVKEVEKTDPEGQAKKRKPSREEEEQLQAEQAILAPSPLNPHHHTLFESGSGTPKTGNALGSSDNATSRSSSGAVEGVPDYESQEPSQSSFQGQGIPNTPDDPLVFSDDPLNSTQNDSNNTQNSSQTTSTQKKTPEPTQDQHTPQKLAASHQPKLQSTHPALAIKKKPRSQKPKPEGSTSLKTQTTSTQPTSKKLSKTPSKNQTQDLDHQHIEPSQNPKKSPSNHRKDPKTHQKQTSLPQVDSTPTQIPGTIAVPFALDGTPTPPVTPTNAGYLSPQVHQIFQTMVGLVIVKQLTEGSEGTQTQISLNNPEYENSIFYGLKLVITQYKTAPGAFNIELQGTSTQNALLNAESAKLISALNDNRYNLPFTINRLEVSLKKEDESTFLFKRKQKLDKDPKDHP
jgi:hypothetical protein